MSAETSSAEARRLAYVTWSALAEPTDAVAAWLVTELGPVDALTWVASALRDPAAASMQLFSRAAPRDVDRAVKATERWRERIALAEPDAHLERAGKVGARAVTRVDNEWPTAMDDLGSAAPYCLWVRGPLDVGRVWDRSIAVVGARSSTAYGDHMAGVLASGVADEGWAVISGGAFGIDARAHHGALGVDGTTLAVMAGGVDRLYPAGNDDLLKRLVEVGAVVSEVPPGYAPHRSRFLTRNRLIAAARATVVVEAAQRSGALSTARHAAEILRPLGAVPGPATSASSAGCHALMRDGLAVCVTAPEHAIELAGPMGVVPGAGGADSLESRASAGKTEFARPEHRRVYDAIPSRGATAERISRDTGLSPSEVRAALGALELDESVRREAGVWRKFSA